MSAVEVVAGYLAAAVISVSGLVGMAVLYVALMWTVVTVAEAIGL